MDLGLSGKKAILVGSGRGIGRATAELLAAEGCAVAIGSRTEAQVNDTAEALKAAGATVFAKPVDVADPAAYQAWVDEAADALGGCDIFSCFTSGGGGGFDDAAWKNNFELDVMATVRGCNAALPHLAKSDAAAIVAIASTAGVESFMGPQAYNTAKAAVINYAANLSQHVAAQGIRVNTVSPGPVFIEDGMWDFIKQNMPDIYEGAKASVPLGKRMASDVEIARVIAFAASPAASFMTGSNLVVDGGSTKRVQY